MASSKTAHPSKNKGSEATDSPETHHDDSENRPDDLDAEEEIVFKHDSDDDNADDGELDTRGCVPDSEDHVESESEVEEEEGDDYVEDDDSDDDNKFTIPQPKINEPFGPANPHSELDSEDACIERCDRRLANVTEFLKKKTDEADWDEPMSPEAWVYRGFKQALARSSAEKIIQIFKGVIPASTRAILGRSALTHEDIMALPIIDAPAAGPGVYVICLTLSEDQHNPEVPDEDSTDSLTDEQPEVPDKDSTDSPAEEHPEVPQGVLVDFTMDEYPEVPHKDSTDSPTHGHPEVPDENLMDFTMDEHPEVPDKESTDSPAEEHPEVPQGVLVDFTIDEYPEVPDKQSTDSPMDERSEVPQGVLIDLTTDDETKLLDDRRWPNKKILMYLYCYAKKYVLAPSYRQVAFLPKQLEGIDFPHADTRWLVRMLEHVVTLLLGTYGPSQTNPHKQRYGYTEEMYLETLAQCGIPLGIFHPLNHAMPLKQKCGWTVGARVCHNCESQTTAANGWYYDPTACEVAVLYNCSACYWYRVRTGKTRPPELFVGLKARPTSGPCANCDATESAQWEWHPQDKNHIICSKCRAHWTRYAIYRPPKKQKFCSDCGATEIKGHFHRASGLDGKKNGQYWCATCAMRRQRRRDREARENKHANLTCLTCGNSNPAAWRTYRTCLSCWEKSNAAKRFRKTRERTTCWYCQRVFQKQKQTPLFKHDWRDERKWHPTLNEWICKDCSLHCNDYGSFGIRASDLEAFEIRCEDCHTLYTKNWSTLDNERIICGNCYQRRYMNLNRRSPGNDRKNAKGKGKAKSAKGKEKAKSAKGKGKAKSNSNTSRPKLLVRDKSNHARGDEEETWQEKKGKKVKENRPFPQTKLLLPYLLRVHGKDFRADGIIAEKVANDNLESSF
ncbi:unnamed protein product [Penicillium palitans]